MGLRKVPRFQCACPVSFSAAGLAGQGAVVNLSLKGCKVACRQRIQMGTELSLRVALPDDASPLQVERSIVRWAVGKYMGLEFLVIEDKHQARLLKFVNSLETQDKILRPKCPRCERDLTKRVHCKGVGELVASLCYVYPFRCQVCAHRFKVLQWGRRYVRQTVDRREYQRIPVSFSATFLGEGVQGEGLVTDISVRGCSLKTDTHLWKLKMLQVLIQVPRSEFPIVVEAAVVRSVRPGAVGLEFLRFALESEKRLSVSLHDQLVSHID
jgi:hypothetical protein